MNRYYFAIITYDFCKYAEMSMITLFMYNDIVLNLFVVDNNYNDVLNYYSGKSYRNNLNIINIFNSDHNDYLFNIEHNSIIFDSRIAHLTLWTFRILDYIDDNEIMRIDLDIMYFGDITQFFNYPNAMVGIREAEAEYYNIKKYNPNAHTPRFQINVGLCKFNKSKFGVKSFENEMHNRLLYNSKDYLVPEQDILNEMTNDKVDFPDKIVITNFTDITKLNNCNKNDIIAFHFNGSSCKPWLLYRHNNIQINNFNYVCGVELCKEFANKFNFFKKELNISSIYTRWRYIKHTENEEKLVSVIEALKNTIKSWKNYDN